MAEPIVQDIVLLEVIRLKNAPEEPFEQVNMHDSISHSYLVPELKNRISECTEVILADNIDFWIVSLFYNTCFLALSPSMLVIERVTL